jgi:hypothetical protein
MTRLTDFLSARIAEDEAAARAVLRRGRRAIAVREEGFGVYNDLDRAALANRFDADRVLLDCETRRRIVERAGDLVVEAAALDPRAPVAFAASAYGQVMLELVQAYRDHPDLVVQWRIAGYDGELSSRGQHGPSADYGDGMP